MKVALVLALLVAVGLSQDFCWKSTHTRGAGHILSTCSGNQEKSGLICYDKCKEGYYGVGPVCWQHCPAGYHDDGLFCRKDAHIYGKGCCCTIWGCCHNCNSGYTDDGCTCRKNAHIFAKSSYGRGVGNSMGCGAGLVQSGLLCYPQCQNGFHGVGPVCWGTCPPGWSDCGAGCAPTSKGCGDKIINMVSEVGAAVANTISMIVGDNNKSKTAQKVKKVADTIKNNAAVAAKYAKYANQILTAAREKGIEMTQAQAEQQAEETIAQVAAGLDEGQGDNWDVIFEKLSSVDPTGLVAASKQFKNPMCHTLH